MVLLINAHGMTITDPETDTISVSSFLDTSEQGYAVTEENQTEGTYSLGAVATQTLSAEDTEEEADAEDSDATDAEDEKLEEGRLTVLAADSLINAQVTDSFTTLENLDLFMNTISSNFDDMQNVAIEAKSLEITYNTMQARRTDQCRPDPGTSAGYPGVWICPLVEEAESIKRKRRKRREGKENVDPASCGFCGAGRVLCGH